jgi:hypothetical protein
VSFHGISAWLQALLLLLAATALQASSLVLLHCMHACVIDVHGPQDLP